MDFTDSDTTSGVDYKKIYITKTNTDTDFKQKQSFGPEELSRGPIEEKFKILCLKYTCSSIFYRSLKRFQMFLKCN